MQLLPDSYGNSPVRAGVIGVHSVDSSFCPSFFDVLFTRDLFVSLSQLLSILRLIAMAIPIRSIPVLEGEVAERFEKKARWAEKHRGSILISQEERKSFKRLMERSKKNFA